MFPLVFLLWLLSLRLSFGGDQKFQLAKLVSRGHFFKARSSLKTLSWHTTYPVDQILQRLVQLYGNESVVNIDNLEVVHIAQTVVDGLDAQLASRMSLQFEDFAPDGQILGHPLETAVLAHWVKLAACIVEAKE